MDIKRGEIYYVQFPEDAVGSEQRGLRPALILQNDIGNKKSTTTVVVAITSKVKKKYPMHHKISGEGGLPKDSVVLCEQLKTIDKKRIVEKIGYLSELTMREIEEKIMLELGISS